MGKVAALLAARPNHSTEHSYLCKLGQALPQCVCVCI